MTGIPIGNVGVYSRYNPGIPGVLYGTTVSYVFHLDLSPGWLKHEPGWWGLLGGIPGVPPGTPVGQVGQGKVLTGPPLVS